MNRREKEFKVQRALGLAEECTLQITANGLFKYRQIKNAVKKHSFTFKFLEKKRCSLTMMAFKFKVKAVYGIIQHITEEFYPHYIEIRKIRSISDKVLE